MLETQMCQWTTLREVLVAFRTLHPLALPSREFPVAPVIKEITKVQAQYARHLFL
jgi:hypothetical protein